ncbi:MAG TPA: 50S ribosomal protein L1 [Candidatus Saccharimonadales bacterium]|nr:50S ribosomal protein L1 [Candidatus Saccharimonadales bacterium]
MAKTKAELLEEAKKLGIEVADKAKVAEIKALIDQAEVSEAETATAEETADAAATAEVTAEPEPAAAEVAKAGKRSAKALKEAEEKEAKEARKASGEATEAKPKQPVKPTRSRLERRAKGYRKSAEQIEKDKQYTLEQAVELAKKTSHVKFDATVELHVKLGVDPRQADQNVRDNLVLPAGTGKNVKIAVFTDDAAAAKQAGAALAGIDEILALLDKGTTDFDILIATPSLMPQLGKYARVLGPRGLMPNPKSGTVTTDVNRAVAEAKAGRVEYRVDSTGIVHLGVGKVSFEPAKLLENIQAVLASLKAAKPQSLKGTYLQAVYLTTSMGPSISVDITNIG